MSASNAPYLELTEGNLRLRPSRPEEAALYARWWADEEALWGFACEPRSAAGILAAFPEMEAEARDIGHPIEFVMDLGGAPAGCIWLSHWDLEDHTAELNILIGEPEQRRRGLARRAIRLLCAWAFPTMGLRRIRLCPREDHVPAIRCYRGAGAHLGELTEDAVTWQGETVCFRELYYLPTDFPQGNADSSPAE